MPLRTTPVTTLVERVIVEMMPEHQRDLTVEQSRPSASERSDDAGECQRDLTVEVQHSRLRASTAVTGKHKA
jgi:hypothetical protein